jgi:hypothetical protein
MVAMVAISYKKKVNQKKSKIKKSQLKLLTYKMDLIVKHCVFGETRCWMYSEEWQKCGLPHAYRLI